LPIASLTVYPRFVVNYDFSHFTIFGYLTKKISQSLWVVALYKILKAVSLLLLYVFLQRKKPKTISADLFFSAEILPLCTENSDSFEVPHRHKGCLGN